MRGSGWKGQPGVGLALAALLGLLACGSPTTEREPGFPTAVAGRQESSAPLVPPPVYAEKGAQSQSPESALREILQLRGRDGILLLRKGDHVQQVRVLEHSAGGLEPGGGYGFHGRITVDDRKRYAKFLFGGAGTGEQQIQKILVLTHHTQTPYTWSDEEGLWVAGQEVPIPP
ncbi:MAG: hypothetical protein ACOX9B_06620 [Candidatus Xenobium sp.]|jgi:hypothetical protein|nr:hypothetical protein [Burkholderiales bacterium]